MRLGTRKLSLAGLVVLIGTLALLLSACGGGTSSGKLPDDKQIFRPLDIGPSNGDLETIDPAKIHFGVDYDRASMIFPALITLDDNLKPLPWAAKALPDVSSDGTVYTFHLNDGMQWSDGTPIDANTFAYSMNRSLDPCTGSDVASYLYNLKGAEAYNNGTCPKGATKSTDTLIGKSIKVVDAKTLELTLEGPAGYFLGALSYPTSYGVPQKLIEANNDGWTDDLVKQAGGFGGNLFKLTVWDHKGHLNFVRNDKFWGTKSQLKEIDFTYYKDTGALWNDFKTGQGDIGAPVAAELDLAKSLPKTQYQEIGQLAVSYLQVNWHLAPFDDVRMRNAFSLAIDRKAIATQVLKNASNPNINMVVKGLPGYNANLKNAAGDSGDAALVANVTKAKALADDYAKDKCSGDLSKCTPIVYTYTAKRPTTEQTAQALVDMWQKAFPGLKITTATIDRGQQIHSGKILQLTNAGWGADYPDPQDFLTLLWSKNAAYNQSFVDLPAADALLDKADKGSDLNTRLPLYQQAEQLFTDNGAWIVLTQPKSVTVVRNTASGFHYTASLVVSLPTYQTMFMKAA